VPKNSRPRTGSYEDLVVWQKSTDLAVAIYDVTKRFPREERFGLTSQLRRAAISVSANIAEGWGRSGKAELRYRLLVAKGSLNEVESELLVALRLGYLDAGALVHARELISEIRRMIVGLRRALERVR